MTSLVDFWNLLPDVFDIDKVANELSKKVTRRTVNRRISQYTKQNRLERIGTGLYAKKSANQFDIAQYVYKGYVGFSSALYLRGLKNEVEDLVYVCVSRPSKELNTRSLLIRPVNLGKMCFGTELINGILVSTYPKTVFDMLYKPKSANLYDLYRALKERELSKQELLELLNYASKSNLSTVRRIGYSFQNTAPEWFIRRLQKLNKDKGVSFFLNKRAINLSKEWMLYDDLNVKRWINAIRS